MSLDDAQTIWRDPRVHEHRTRTETLLRVLVRPGMRVLDVGCGYGRFAPCVTACGASWLGVEHDPDMVRHYVRAGYPGEVVQEDCLHPAALRYFEPFDLVMGVLVLNVLHMTPEQFRDRFLHMVKQPGALAVFEAAETYVWHRYAPDLDHISEAIRAGGAA